jgi:hypothetical protein
MTIGITCASAWLPIRVPHYAWMLLLLGALRFVVPLQASVSDPLLVREPTALASVSTALDFLDAEWQADSDRFQPLQLISHAHVNRARSWARGAISEGEVSLTHLGHATLAQALRACERPRVLDQSCWALSVDAPPDPPPNLSYSIR